MNELRCGVYIHNGILLSHKKEQNNAICSNMGGTRDAHTERSKSERERQIPYGITDIWYLIYSTNERFHRKENHGLGEETCGCPGGEGGSGRDRELGVKGCQLLVLEWISNPILLCSIENSVQVLTSPHNNGRTTYGYMDVYLGPHAAQCKQERNT